jgi:hypothetical protein
LKSDLTFARISKLPLNFYQLKDERNTLSFLNVYFEHDSRLRIMSEIILIFITGIQFKSSPFIGFGSASAVQKICFCVMDMETASGKQEITFGKMSFASA